MKKALSLFLAITFIWVCFASLGVSATVITMTKPNEISIRKGENGPVAAKLTATDTYYYNNGYECIHVTDKVEYTREYGNNLHNLPVSSSVVFVYSNYEYPTTKQANSYVATDSKLSASSYVYSLNGYTVTAVYVYHKINQGDSAVAAYTGEMIINSFDVT